MTRARRQLVRFWHGPIRRALPLLWVWLALLSCYPAVAQNIIAAKYSAPTRSYPHGALGDDVEWSTLRLTVSRQRGSDKTLLKGHLTLTYEINAPADMVFEDTEPRLWDVDGDARPEVVTVLSHQNFGAQLAVIAYRDGKFHYIAATPLIGQRFRWLAPVGAGDLDGDGHIEIAFVHTPHLSKTLHIWRYRDGEFVAVAKKPGLTNHKIGWDHIPGGMRDCGGTPELVTANEDWSRIVASRFDGVNIHTRDVAAYAGPKSLNEALNCH